MVFHHFYYTIKTLFHNKMLIFWTFAFPIILGTLFSFAFSNIEKSEKLQIIDIAIVENEELAKDESLKQTFETLSDPESEERLFFLTYETEEKANEMLQDDEITGYVIMTEKEPKVVVKQNGINETILHDVVEEIMQTQKIMTDVVTNQMQQGMDQQEIAQIIEKVQQKMQQEENQIKDESKTNLSYTMIEFYTLIAMTCLYGAILGVYAINHVLANMSSKGKRVAISPVAKGKLVLGTFLASYVTQLLGLVLLFVYTIFVLQIDYGTRILPVIGLALAGSLAGLSFGVAVGTLLKANENTKTGMIIAFTMVGCFLSGMMGITMKYIVDKNVPIVNLVNPANMITDGFYALYYYDTLHRYWFDLGSLLLFSGILIGLSMMALRRQKYDSI